MFEFLDPSNRRSPRAALLIVALAWLAMGCALDCGGRWRLPTSERS